MRPEDRDAVWAALTAAAGDVRKPVPLLRTTAAEMRVRTTLLMRDMQGSIASGFGIPSFAVGVWGGSEESLELAVSRLKAKYKLTGEQLDAQVAKHNAIGRDPKTRVTKNDREKLRQLREDKRFWKRWRNGVDGLLERLGGVRGAKFLGRVSRVIGHPAVGMSLDFFAVAFGSPMLKTPGSKAVAGTSLALTNLAASAIPGYAIFAMFDSAGMMFLGDKGYSQVSIGNMTTTTAQTLGAFDEAIRTGDYSGLEAIHQMSLDGKTTVVQTAGAYVGDMYTSGDIRGYHDESLAGQHGKGAENMAVTGETIHEMVTAPGSVISDAWEYWGSKW
ncbi:MAG TPA: hypothetical protein PK020_07775 [Ilumatobacteraceae bacterium]|nr:hypothetical protein [Ilumatobacteraceae bacterium]HRB02125.1 hypothetical protein [Ilumatobacteraceae bacterium]